VIFTNEGDRAQAARAEEIVSRKQPMSLSQQEREGRPRQKQHVRSPVHFDASEGGRRPLKTIFRQIIIEPLVFVTFGEMSSNVVGLVETAVEYGVEHMGRNMAATTVKTVRTTLRRRYKTQLSMVAWRGYANLLLDRMTYVGAGHSFSDSASHEEPGRYGGTCRSLYGT